MLIYYCLLFLIAKPSTTKWAFTDSSTFTFSITRHTTPAGDGGGGILPCKATNLVPIGEVFDLGVQPGTSFMNCPYHSLTEFLRGARLHHREGWNSGFIGRFEDA